MTQGVDGALPRKLLMWMIPLVLSIVVLIVVNEHPVSWDEGWNFCVARNLVEQRHFGCSILGEFTSARLANGWVPILSAAAGFQVFGFEPWAGRAFLAVFTGLAIFALGAISSTFAGVGAGSVALLSLIVLSSDPRVNPLIVGAQVWGELPMILAVALGLGLLGTSLKRGWIGGLFLVALACVCFGVALQTKIQLQPFFVTSFLVTSGVLLVRKEWRSAALVIALLAGSWWCLHNIAPTLPYRPVIVDPGAGATGPAATVGFVLDLQTRLTNIEFALTQGWFLFLALGYLAFRFVRDGFRFHCVSDSGFEPVVLALYLLVASWLGWFLFFAIDFARYLAPPLILGVPLVVLAIGEVTKGFKFRESAREWVELLRGPPALAKKGVVAMILALAALHVVVVTGNLLRFGVSIYHDRSNEDLKEIVTYINEQTPPGSIIETYETMAFYRLERPFHYPPDQIAFDAIKESYSGGRQRMAYDPLGVKPSYVLIGPWGRGVFKIYEELERSGNLIEQKRAGDFILYRAR